MRERGLMAPEKTLQLTRNRTGGYFIRPTEFIFFDKRTGTRRFEVEADERGNIPVEKAVSMLAIHCLARQQTPRDFGVMVAAGKDVFDGIAEGAAKLIQSCSGAKIAGFRLSRRQREVLASVTNNMTNKEIAAKLNVSVRTIKFHVSALLEKFDVQGRVDLMLESAAVLPVDNVHRRVSNPELMTLDGGPSSPMLPDRRTKLLLAASIDRRAGRTIGIGKRAPRCTSEPSSSITSPRAAS
jgi:DNA-binding CsgD family transcriptional regulator